MIRIFRALLLVMLLVMVALVSAVVTMHFAIHGAEVKVPDLRSMSAESAARRAADMNLNFTIDGKYYSASVPAGHVLTQSPDPGALVRREWRMRVTESLGPQRVSIPDVVGMDARIASIEVRRLGLDLGETAQMPSPAPPGTVLAQDPPHGAPGVAGPGVSLLVSAPQETPRPPAFVMPQLAGLSYSAASAAIARAGLRLNPVETIPVGVPGLAPQPDAPAGATAPPPPAAAPGTVLSQTPLAGYRVSAETAITLAVAQ